MKKSKRATLIVGIILVTVGLSMGGRYLIRNQAKVQNTIVVPELSLEARAGEAAFVTYVLIVTGRILLGRTRGRRL